MALKTFVKVSNISNLSDARYCAGMGAEMLGFAVEQDAENYIEPQAYSEMIAWLSGVEFVAEFTRSKLQEINHILEQYPSHAIQVENEEVLAKLLENIQKQEIETLPIKILFRTNQIDFLQQIAEKYQYLVTYFILAEANNVEIEKIIPLTQKYKVLLEGLDSSEQVNFFLEHTHAQGIVLRGTQEIAPGLKDFDNLAEILENLEINEQ